MIAYLRWRIALIKWFCSAPFISRLIDQGVSPESIELIDTRHMLSRPKRPSKDGSSPGPDG